MKNESSVKCVRDLREIPPTAYRLTTDGRKWMHKCRLRCDLAQWLATFANPDGTSITVGVERMTNRLCVSRRTVQRLLDDLETLGFLSNGKLTNFRGTRRRNLNIAAVMATADVPDSQNGDVPNTQSQMRQMETSVGPDTRFESGTTGESATQPSFSDRPNTRPTDQTDEEFEWSVFLAFVNDTESGNSTMAVEG